MFASSATTREQFFRELSRLSGAGLSVSKTAEIMGQRWRGEKVKATMEALQRGLANGGTIAEAMAPELTPLERGMVDAAERGGMLAQGFRHLEEYYHLLAHTSGRIRRALAYPVFMLHAGVLLPALVRGMTTEAGLIWTLVQALLWLYGCLFLAWLLWRGVSTMAQKIPAVDAVLLRVPVIGSARRSLALARWHAVFHFNLKAGQRISAGLLAAGAAAQSARIETATAIVADAAEHGEEIGPALEAQSIFPHEMTSALFSAEVTGTLDAETLRQSREFMIDAAQRMDTAAEWTPKIIYGVIMIFVVIQIFTLASGIVGSYSSAINELGL